jgi:hypothetical protein
MAVVPFIWAFMNLTLLKEVPRDGGATVCFLEAVEASLNDKNFVKLVFSKPRGLVASDLKRVTARHVVFKNGDGLSFVFSHATRDVTQNLPISQGLVLVSELINGTFGCAYLFTVCLELQWMVSKKGQQTLLRHEVKSLEPRVAQTHDREKRRWVALERPFLQALGVADAHGVLVPAMSRKWKQINKFVEIFDRAFRASGLLQEAQSRAISVADFGSGKGYLTFAVHDHLRHSLGVLARVTGVELRPDLVGFCEAVVHKLGLKGLVFDAGDVRAYATSPFDVMIALHACDVATDHAIALGIRSNAAVIVCSPCCHKEIRPQLLSPHPLRPILQHGVHLGQEAEMVTDGLRALLLEASGYEAQVFEFVALEHTAKNKMILAVKRRGPVDVAALMVQVREIKAFYGIQTHCLEGLLFG